MKKDTSYTIRRAQRFPVILIGEGLLVGAVGGLVVLLYRLALPFAGEALNRVLDYIQGNPLRIAGWFAVLAVLALIVGKLVKMEPMISAAEFRRWKEIYSAKSLKIGNACFPPNFWEDSSVFWAVFPWEGKARRSSLAQ